MPIFIPVQRDCALRSFTSFVKIFERHFASAITCANAWHFSANGCAAYRIPSVAKTAERVIATIYSYYKELRPFLAQALGLDSRDMTQGKMSYDLRRLRLHGLIERIAGTHRYQLTSLGLRAALFYSRTFNRVIRPGLSQITDPSPPGESSKLTAAFLRLETELTNYLEEKKAA